MRVIQQTDKESLVRWGERIVSVLPEEEREPFRVVWTEHWGIGEIEIAPPPLERWGAYVAIGYPRAIRSGTVART